MQDAGRRGGRAHGPRGCSGRPGARPEGARGSVRRPEGGPRRIGRRGARDRICRRRHQPTWQPRRPLPVVVDASALAHPTVYVSAGQRGVQVELAPADLVRCADATVAPIARSGDSSVSDSLSECNRFLKGDTVVLRLAYSHEPTGQPDRQDNRRPPPPTAGSLSPRRVPPHLTDPDRTSVHPRPPVTHASGPAVRYALSLLPRRHHHRSSRLTTRRSGSEEVRTLQVPQNGAQRASSHWSVRFDGPDPHLATRRPGRRGGPAPSRRLRR